MLSHRVAIGVRTASRIGISGFGDFEFQLAGIKAVALRMRLISPTRSAQIVLRERLRSGNDGALVHLGSPYSASFDGAAGRIFDGDNQTVFSQRNEVAGQTQPVGEATDERLKPEISPLLRK
jgi:hypothetical protein